MLFSYFKVGSNPPYYSYNDVYLLYHFISLSIVLISATKFKNFKNVNQAK